MWATRPQTDHGPDPGTPGVEQSRPNTETRGTEILGGHVVILGKPLKEQKQSV